MQGNTADLDFAITTMEQLYPGTHVAPGSVQPIRDPNAFLLLPNSRRIRVIAPTQPRRAAAAGLARNSSPVSRRQSAARALGRLGLLGGLGPLVPHKLRLAPSDPPMPSIVDHLGDLLGEQVTVAIAIGTQRANRKPVMKVMDRSGRTLAFAKVGCNQPTKELVALEANALECLGETEWTTFTTPRLIGFGEFNSCDVLVMAPVPTGGAKGLGDPDARRALVQELSGGFGQQHDPVQGGEYLARLRTTLGSTPDEPLAAELRALLGTIEEQFSSSALTLGAWHGDFTAWNMATSNGRTHVWDWERFDTRIPVGLDEIHFCVNSVAQRHGFTPPTLLAGLRESTWTYPTHEETSLHQALYLATVATRYIAALAQEGGRAVQPKAAVLVETLGQVLRVRGRHTDAG